MAVDRNRAGGRGDVDTSLVDEVADAQDDRVNAAVTRTACDATAMLISEMSRRSNARPRALELRSWKARSVAAFADCPSQETSERDGIGFERRYRGGSNSRSRVILRWSRS
jgi:hypothetical protein